MMCRLRPVASFHSGDACPQRQPAFPILRTAGINPLALGYQKRTASNVSRLIAKSWPYSSGWIAHKLKSIPWSETTKPHGRHGFFKRRGGAHGCLDARAGHRGCEEGRREK